MHNSDGVNAGLSKEPFQVQPEPLGRINLKRMALAATRSRLLSEGFHFCGLQAQKKLDTAGYAIVPDKRLTHPCRI